MDLPLESFDSTNSSISQQVGHRNLLILPHVRAHNNRKHPSSEANNKPLGKMKSFFYLLALSSIVLSRAQSDYPSLVPSDMPSMLPSDLPSDMPSDMPSEMPSSAPSKAPKSSKAGKTMRGRRKMRTVDYQ